MKYAAVLLALAASFALGYLHGHNTGESPEDIEITQFNESNPSNDLQSNNLDTDVSSNPLAETRQCTCPATENITSLPTTSSDIPPDTLVSDSSESLVESTEQSTVTDPVLAETPFPVAQSELDDWVETHKDELKENMEALMGENANFMFDKIMEENGLLTEPKAASPIEDDLRWRQQMESRLESVFYQLNDSPTLELNSLVCIQKQCEITLTGQDMQHVTVFFIKFITVINKSNTVQPSKPVLHMNDDGTFWKYFQLKF